MDVRARLTSAAVRAAHVLVVEAPGGWRERFAAERAAAARGWTPAASPADADVLVVCGAPGDDLAALLDRVWDQLPGPRARAQVRSPTGAGQALAEAAALLADERHQRRDARERRQEPAPLHGDMDHGGTDHGGMDHGDMAPAGIPLASGGPDRDGLEMDVLHLSLGPVLPSWPAGLVLDVALQGDVVVSAEARHVGGPTAEGHHGLEPPERAAYRVDGVARLLDLAGWPDAASRARRTRDVLLDGDSATGHRLLVGLRSRVGRSRLLRWQLRGLGPPGRPDVHDRLLRALARAVDDLGRDAGDPGDGTSEDGGAGPDGLASATVGLELAAVRLVVAAADLDRLPTRREVVGG